MHPDDLSSEIIISHLTTREIGRRLVYNARVNSTMETAVEQVLLGAPNGAVIVAGAQENGKGRFDRRWISPEGGLYLSIILYPPGHVLSSLTMLASLAVRDAVTEVSGIITALKWPNDVLIDGKKVCGILAVSGESPSKRIYAIVGIGINTGIDPRKYPEIAVTGAGLDVASGKQVSRTDLLCSLLGNFEKRYERLCTGDSQLGEWSEALATLGQKVTVKTGDKTFNGTAESVDGEGNLRLRLENGELKVIPAGDVTLKT